MPRTGGVYSPPAGTKGVPNTTIQSVPYNTLIDDLTADANAPRPVTAGGTGATSASGARTALGVEIGSNVQAYDAGLQSIAGLTTVANQMLYTTGTDLYATTALTLFARTVLDDADAASMRGTIGANDARNLTIGTIADARLPGTMSGKSFTGDVYAPNSISGAVLVRSDSNRPVWFQTAAGTTRAVIYHDNSAELFNIQLFNTSGTFVRNLSIQQNGIMQWAGNVLEIGQPSGTAELRLNAAVNMDFRLYGDAFGGLYVQKSTDNWAGAFNLLYWDNSALATFANDVNARSFFSTSSGAGTNFKVGDDAWIGDINAIDTLSIRGQQNFNNGFIRFGNSPNPLGVSAVAGNDRLYWGGSYFLQGDGNQYLPFLGMFLNSALDAKAGVYTGSFANETVFPIGHPLMVSGNIDRNAATSVWHNSGNNLDYTTTASGSQLAGTYRGRGRPVGGATLVQRTA